MKRLAVIGCGLRSDCYLNELRNELGRELHLVGLADPSPVALDVYMTNYGNPNVRTFNSGPELLNKMGDALDAVIIGSPNALHLESLLPALKRKLIVLLEKPVATSVEDCVSMWKAYQEAGRTPLAVGFVLRYTTFYRKVRELLDCGAIGQILSIEATEMLGAPLTANYTRGWRRKENLAGPFILEKCSHDMDLLNWFVGVPVAKVSSFATRTRFVPCLDAATHCRECRLAETCRYHNRTLEPYLMNVARRNEIERLIPADNDLCVFNTDKDVPDHQIINLEYANGVLATFTACMDQPKTTRTIKINGTLGQIVGDISKDELRVDYHMIRGAEQCTSKRIKIECDNSAHHGGDSNLSNQFKAMLRDEPVPPLAGLKEGIEACLIAFAAEQSRHEGKIVKMKDLHQKVFIAK